MPNENPTDIDDEKQQQQPQFDFFYASAETFEICHEIDTETKLKFAPVRAVLECFNYLVINMCKKELENMKSQIYTVSRDIDMKAWTDKQADSFINIEAERIQSLTSNYSASIASLIVKFKADTFYNVIEQYWLLNAFEKLRYDEDVRQYVNQTDGDRYQIIFNLEVYKSFVKAKQLAIQEWVPQYPLIDLSEE